MISLDDLTVLAKRYVPKIAQHPNSLRPYAEAWWPAHELGHLLTTERELHQWPMFGLDDDRYPCDLTALEVICRELAAMDVSRRLLRACRRPDLVTEERDGTDFLTLSHEGNDRVRQILRKFRVTHIPRSREGLEALCKRTRSKAWPTMS